MALNSTVSVPLRISTAMYEDIERHAALQGQSISTFIIKSLESAVADAAVRELVEGFNLVAQYPDECDVEYAIAAQSEVMLCIDS